jgi:hypothetical protein
MKMFKALETRGEGKGKKIKILNFGIEIFHTFSASKILA